MTLDHNIPIGPFRLVIYCRGNLLGPLTPRSLLGKIGDTYFPSPPQRPPQAGTRHRSRYGLNLIFGGNISISLILFSMLLQCQMSDKRHQLIPILRRSQSTLTPPSLPARFNLPLLSSPEDGASP